MYSLRVTCPIGECESVSAELWDVGTVAIGEVENGDSVTLIAGFEANDARERLLERFSAYSPEWQAESTDWVRHTQEAWPGRVVGERIFLAPPWFDEAIPAGRLRIVHNPGLACGTGEHPCTQLALEALGRDVTEGAGVADIGTGSGLLAIAALRLGAGAAIGIDPDFAALTAARENFQLNGLAASLINGTAGCIASGWADVTVANISGTVLLAIFDDLRRITKAGGRLIVTGFPESEAAVLRNELGASEMYVRDGWCCLTATVSSAYAS